MSNTEDIFKTDDLKKIPIGKCTTVPVDMREETIQVMACHTSENNWNLEGKGIKGSLTLSDL